MLSTSCRVGINTAGPVAPLHVEGAAFFGQGLIIGPGGSATTVRGFANGGAIEIKSNGLTTDRWLRLGQVDNNGVFTPYMHMSDGGFVGIGTTTPAATLDVNGNIRASGSITGASVIGAVYQDVAEWVPASEAMGAGTVVVLNPNRNNEVMPSHRAYDTAVAGVVSEKPGLILGVAADSKAQIATTGRVRVHVDATNAPVNVGDLLVTSDTPGVAMVSQPVDVAGVKIHRPGTLIGKALEPLQSGRGDILVLLSLQ